MQDEPPAVEPALDGDTVAEMVIEAFANALVDWWWFWLLFLAVGIALALLNSWSRRVEARVRRRKQR